MSKPSVLHAVDELDKTGFYNNSTLLGDVRTTPTLLDTVLDNGIYTFIGGTDSPTDNNGNYKWCLRVYSSDDCTSTEHIAERYILNDDKRKVFVRSRSSNTWTSWVEDAGSGGVFIATYGKTTSAEIEAAYQEGKEVLCYYGGMYRLIRRQNDRWHYFFGSNSNGNMLASGAINFSVFKVLNDEWTTINLASPASAHASTHASGGTDPITPEDIGAVTKTYVDNLIIGAMEGGY